MEKIILANSIPKIRDLQQNELQTIEQTFRYVFLLIGLRRENQPSEAESMVLAKFVLDYLGKYTTEDIKLAYELAVAKQLKVDVRCFQMFTAQYLGEIMDAYSIHLSNAKMYQRREEEKRKLAEEKVYTEEEKKKIDESFFKTMVIDEFENYKKTGQINIFPISVGIVYKTMKEKGLIIISEKERREIYDEFRFKIISAKMEKPIDLSDMITQDEESRIKMNCQLRVITNTFEKMKKENYEF